MAIQLHIFFSQKINVNEERKRPKQFMQNIFLALLPLDLRVGLMYLL